MRPQQVALAPLDPWVQPATLVCLTLSRVCVVLGLHLLSLATCRTHCACVLCVPQPGNLSHTLRHRVLRVPLCSGSDSQVYDMEGRYVPQVGRGDWQQVACASNSLCC